jgi:hypothetical protein
MIGDRTIFVAHSLAGSRHLLDRMTPVAPRAVQLEIASNVIKGNKRRILALDIQQISVCIECMGDLDVLHPWSLPAPTHDRTRLIAA